MPIPQRGVAGREIARGGQQLGDALFGGAMQERQLDERERQVDHDLQMAELGRRRQAEIADAAGRFADIKGQLAVRAEELRVASQPGAVGHSAAFDTEVNSKLSEFAGTLSNDPEVQARFKPIVDSARSELTTREKAWEIGEFGKYQGAQWSKFADAAKVDLQATPTLEKLQQALDQSTDLIDGMGVPGNLRAALLDATHRDYVTTVLNAQIAGGPDGVKAAREILKGGMLDPFLTAEIKEKLYLDADRADERARIVADRAEADAQRSAKQTLDGVQKLLDSGVEPTADQMKLAEAAVAQLPPEQRVEYAVMETQLAVNRETRGLGVDEIRHRRDFLRGKVDSGKSTQTEQMMLAAYDKRLDTAEDREAEDSKVNLGAGVTGRIAAVERLQGRDPETRFRVGEKTEEGLGFAASLPTAASRRQAIEGADVRKNRKDLFDDKANKQMREAFRNNIGRVGNGLRGSEYAGREGLAMDLYAAHVARTGKTEFDRNLFWQYQNIAFGATRRGDGVYQGGLGTVNGGRVELPQEMTPAEFSSFIARSNWPTAVDSRGVKVDKSFITSKMVPVLDDISADGRTYYYQMVGPGGSTLQDKDGRPLRLPVPRRGKGAP